MPVPSHIVPRSRHPDHSHISASVQDTTGATLTPLFAASTESGPAGTPASWLFDDSDGEDAEASPDISAASLPMGFDGLASAAAATQGPAGTDADRSRRSDLRGREQRCACSSTGGGPAGDSFGSGVRGLPVTLSGCNWRRGGHGSGGGAHPGHPPPRTCPWQWLGPGPAAGRPGNAGAAAGAGPEPGVHAAHRPCCGPCRLRLPRRRPSAAAGRRLSCCSAG